MNVIDLKLPGVSFYARTGKWCARISEGGARKHLGYFETQEAASAAYEEARGARPPTRKKRPPAKPLSAVRAPAGVWAALFSPMFVSLFICDDDALDEVAIEAIEMAGEVSRRENVSTHVAGDVITLGAYEKRTSDMFPAETFCERIRLARRLGIMDRLGELSSRVAPFDPDATFRIAAHELAFGDMV